MLQYIMAVFGIALIISSCSLILAIPKGIRKRHRILIGITIITIVLYLVCIGNLIIDLYYSMHEAGIV